MSNTTKDKVKVQTIKFVDEDFRANLKKELESMNHGVKIGSRLRSWAKKTADLTLDECIEQYYKVLNKTSTFSAKERQFLSLTVGKALNKTRRDRSQSKQEEE